MTGASGALRYRISGMDCGRDATQIEGAARSAGAQAVRVSLATHVMTIEASPDQIADIERAVAATGFDAERMGELDDAMPAHRTPAYRRALWTVVLLNVGYGIVEMVGGFLAESQALKADALDFIGDGLITFLGVLAIGWSIAWRARSAYVQGMFLGLLGVSVLLATVYRLVVQTTPDAALMGAFGVGALIVNVLAVLPLLAHRHGDANIRAVWLFSRNDAIGNAAVVMAAGLVVWSGTAWPDLIVALGIAGLFLHSSWTIVRDARSDLAAA